MPTVMNRFGSRNSRSAIHPWSCLPLAGMVFPLRKMQCWILLCSLSVLGIQIPAFALAAGQAQDGLRDGQHDFDFNIGTWHTHIRRILDPLSGLNASIELDGTVTVRKIWGGRAQLEEIEADGPNGHWEGLTLFLYNPQAHQWSQTFASSKDGTLTTPLVGSFKDGRGELYSQDTIGGRSILVRGVWSEITPTSHKYEESYSADGGRTWAPAFIGNLTRVEEPQNTSATPASKTSDSSAVQNEFSFDLGAWKTHSSRLLHPLTGSKEWIEMDGNTTVSKVWNGRANLAEFSADSSSGHLDLISLRLLHPAAQQWSLSFATLNAGILSVPAVGAFHNGRGDFYDYEEMGGKFVLVRFSIWNIDDHTAQSEQAFSPDGGKSWEVNWINRYTRMDDTNKAS